MLPTPRNHTCLHCGKKFAGIQFLHIHEDAHRGDYPYRCEICGKGSFTMSNLKHHMTTHDGVRDYKCSECAQEFTRACSLKRCVRNLHQDTFRHLVKGKGKGGPIAYWPLGRRTVKAGADKRQ